MPTISVNGTTLYYLDDGPPDAPAVVCSPSMFFDARMFAAQADALSDRYRVIRYDHRGQGQSARHSREHLDMDTLTADAAALIEELQLGPVTFVGNSMGGFVALRLGARRPDLIRSIVVMGTSADQETPERIADITGLCDILAENGMEPVLESVLYVMVGDTTLNDPSREELLADVKAVLLSRGPDCADAAWHIATRPPILDELHRITAPLLVVSGSEDHSYPTSYAEQIVSLVPQAELEIMPHTGHVHALESPAEVNALLERHLASIAHQPSHE
jgi:3-oxoadipate enol-lactonase